MLGVHDRKAIGSLLGDDEGTLVENTLGVREGESLALIKAVGESVGTILAFVSSAMFGDLEGSIAIVVREGEFVGI